MEFIEAMSHYALILKLFDNVGLTNLSRLHFVTVSINMYLKKNNE